MMRGRSTDWRRFNSSVSAGGPVEVIGTLSIVFVLRSRMLWKACAQLLSDRALVPPQHSNPPAPVKGHATFIRGGEFQPYWLYYQPPRGVAARSTISFRKSNSEVCGPQGLRRDRHGYPRQPPSPPKEWCNRALYARGQRAAASGCRPAPADPPWC